MNYTQLTDEVQNKLNEIREALPETMQAFSQLMSAMQVDGALNLKQKELIAMGIVIAGRCHACIGFHARKLVKLGCTRAEFMDMLQVAINTGGGPSLMTAAQALQAFEEFGGEKKGEK